MDFVFLLKFIIPTILLVGLLSYGIIKFIKSPRYQFNRIKKAASRGDIEAQTELAIFYYEGKLVKEDLKKAYSLFTNAANHNNLKAINWLGQLYQDGYGVEQDENMAFKWFEKAAKQGDAEGQFNLGMCYNGLGGVERNEKIGMEWLAKAAKQGHAAAANNLAVMLWEGGDGFEGDPVKAFPWTLILANQGDVKNQNEIGRYYLIGYGGFQKDAKIAVEWFKKAAKQKDPTARAILGYLYQTGQGGAYRYGRAYRIYRSLSKYNVAAIQFNRGLLIHTHVKKYVPRLSHFVSYREAGYFYAKAAAQGHAKATYQLATLYEGGFGYLQNYKKAIELYEKAAELNLVEAKQRIDYLRANNFTHDDWRKAPRQNWGSDYPEDPTLLPPDDLSNLVIYPLRK